MPVLLYPTENCQLENLTNEKYEIINPRMLVPQDFSVGMLLNNLRKELCLEEEQALFLYAQTDTKEKKKLLKAGRTSINIRRARGQHQYNLSIS